MSGNDTPDTPDLRESDLRGMKVDELRDRARQEGVEGTSGMRKEELVDAISATHSRGTGGGDTGLRRGEQSSRSLRYSQEITSPDDEPERPGRSLATTNHDVIRQWAEERNGVPATVEGTEHGDRPGVLRFDFGSGSGNDRLRRIGWDEWFETFDARRLNFIYQEERKDGRQSNFFRLESPDREDG
jgi:Rho termination factor, N-terminal domain